MKASELIEKLSVAIELHGKNTEVVIASDYEGHEIHDTCSMEMIHIDGEGYVPWDEADEEFEENEKVVNFVISI